MREVFSSRFGGRRSIWSVESPSVNVGRRSTIETLTDDVRLCQEFVVVVNVFGCLMVAIVYINAYILTRDVRIL